MSFGAIYLSWGSEQAYTQYSGPTLLLGAIVNAPYRAVNNFEAIMGSPGPLKTTPQHALPVPPPPLPRVDGTVDIYSWGQRQVIDEGLDYDPRPIFQSYLTFTSSLAELNAKFLAGSRAPGTILFDLEPIDNHYPSLEDSLSLPELLTRYDLADASGAHLVLRKSAEPRDYELVPLGTAVGSLGRWMQVPQSDDPIWATVDVRLTPLGQLARFLYKPPALLLGINSPAQPPFRIMRDVAAGGFLLSPRLGDRMTLGMLYSKGWKDELADERVTDMEVTAAFSPDGTSPCYQEDFAVQFFGLRYPHFHISGVPGVKDYLDLRQIYRQMTVLLAPPGNRPQLTEDDDGKMVITAAAQTRILVSVPANAREFHFGFGMPNHTFAVVHPTDGVTFRVYAVDRISGSQISAEVAWERDLDPANLSVDRGIQQATVVFPKDHPIYDVLLETDPSPENRLSDAYWTDLKFR
jgi:hypothetical protein